MGVIRSPHIRPSCEPDPPGKYLWPPDFNFPRIPRSLRAPTFPLPFLAQESQEKDTAHSKCSQAGCSAIEALKKKPWNRKRCSPKSDMKRNLCQGGKIRKISALSLKCIISMQPKRLVWHLCPEYRAEICSVYTKSTSLITIQNEHVRKNAHSKVACNTIHLCLKFRIRQISISCCYQGSI